MSAADIRADLAATDPDTVVHIHHGSGYVVPTTVGALLDDLATAAVVESLMRSAAGQLKREAGLA